MNITPFHAPRGCLSYILYDDTHEGIIIDPSDELHQEYLTFIHDHHLHITTVLETHTHADHISDGHTLAKTLGAHIVMSIHSPSKRKTLPLRDLDHITFGKTDVTVWHTPGHTNESLCFLTGHHLFTGDTLLIGGTGRTDFQGGSPKDLYNSLLRILSLADTTVIHPGHNYKGLTSTTLADEKATNTRLRLVLEGRHGDFVTHMQAHTPPLPELFTESLTHNSL